MPRKPRPSPSTLVENWPAVPARDDPAVEVARRLAFVLLLTMQERHLSSRDVGSLCGLNYSTVGAVLRGDTWPDLRTIAMLEVGLDLNLWPNGAARSPQTHSGPWDEDAARATVDEWMARKRARGVVGLDSEPTGGAQ